jgi:hypothetical protein
MKNAIRLPIAIVFASFLMFAACKPIMSPNPVVTTQSATNENVLPSDQVTPEAAPTALPGTERMSPTPLPTLPVTSQIEFYESLANNGGCELPCLLGITPGTTTWEEARSFAESISISKPIVPDPFYTSHISTNHEISLRGYLRFDTDDADVIQSIVFDASIRHGSFTATDDRHLAWYSIGEIIKRYGAPDNIYISTTEGPLDYSLTIVYSGKKLVIQYIGLGRLNEDEQYVICPNMGEGDISQLKLVVAAPEYPKDVKTLMGYPFWEGTRSLEEASGLSSETLYRLLTDEEQPTCLPLNR